MISSHLLTIYLTIIAIICFSCYPTFEVNYEKGSIPSKVTNFEQINTEWDDMNSAGPPHVYNAFTLFLSTNRFSSGAEFNIHWFNVSISFQQTDGIFEINSYHGNRCRNNINSSYDEFGPYILNSSTTDAIRLSYETPVNANDVPSLLLFSSNRNGNSGQDIFLPHPAF